MNLIDFRLINDRSLHRIVINQSNNTTKNICLHLYNGLCPKAFGKTRGYSFPHWSKRPSSWRMQDVFSVLLLSLFCSWIFGSLSISKTNGIRPLSEKGQDSPSRIDGYSPEQISSSGFGSSFGKRKSARGLLWQFAISTPPADPAGAFSTPTSTSAFSMSG